MMQFCVCIVKCCTQIQSTHTDKPKKPQFLGLYHFRHHIKNYCSLTLNSLHLWKTSKSVREFQFSLLPDTLVFYMQGLFSLGSILTCTSPLLQSEMVPSQALKAKHVTFCMCKLAKRVLLISTEFTSLLMCLKFCLKLATSESYCPLKLCFLKALT